MLPNNVAEFPVGYSNKPQVQH